MKQPYRYLVVDDDSTSNLICDFTIQRYNNRAQRNLFTRPEKALEYIREKGPESGITVLFLDVNMPTMSGFEFLVEFQKLPKEVQEQYKIYILTSSIEDFSSQVKKNTCVHRFLSKPLKLSYLEEIALDLQLNSSK